VLTEALASIVIGMPPLPIIAAVVPGQPLASGA